ncbi:MAG TPA: DUF4403 family protein [Nevskiales bacterium]|nr:DUF4403 family protein [Nevskiales bacterium]
MSIRRLAGLGVLLLVLAAAAYWLLPAYVLPPMDISRRPAGQAEPVATTAPVTSYVFIPLALSVDNIKRLVRERLSGKLLTSNLKVPGRQLQVSIERNGTLALWVRDAELHMVLPIRFRTRGDLDAKGELTIFTRASFDVSPEWQPQVDARSTFRWDWQPRVGVWPFRFRIGSLLAPHIQAALDKGADDFSAQAAGLYNLRSIADAGWQRLHGAHLLDAASQTWLNIQPRELYLEPITSDGQEVRLNVWMGGELGLSQGAEPAPGEALPLPSLRRGAPPSKGITLSAPVTVAYERMRASLRDALLGKALPASNGASLVLTEIDLYGADPDAVVALGFEGRRPGSALPVRGRVYLTGKPAYDAASQTLSLRALRVTEPRLNPLTRHARWVVEEAATWAAEIERRTSWDVAPLLGEQRQRLDTLLNRTVDRRFDLWGKVTDVAVTGARAQLQGILLQTQVRGDLELLFVP